MRRLINRNYSRSTRVLLGLSCFIFLFVGYFIGSYTRLQENPDDKLLPSISKMSDSFGRMAFEEQRRTGDILLWKDTQVSLLRITQGLGLAALVGLLVGIAVGAIPVLRHTLSPMITFGYMIPPMAVLPILFIIFGIGEVSKVFLIFIGSVFVITRDIAFRVNELPTEQLVKAQCLGANTWQIIVRVVLPQVLPRLIDVTRLSICTAWLFLIAAEAISSTAGLGYRIFLVRRYLSMDVIIPYVLWITLLGFLMDYGLNYLNRRLFPWYSSK